MVSSIYGGIGGTLHRGTVEGDSSVWKDIIKADGEIESFEMDCKYLFKKEVVMRNNIRLWSDI